MTVAMKTDALYVDPGRSHTDVKTFITLKPSVMFVCSVGVVSNGKLQERVWTDSGRAP